MIVSELSTQVNDLLRPMGITRNLSAYSILCQCLELVCEQEDRLQAVEKDIYTPIADRRRCEPKAIQSAVRRAAKGAWLTNPEYVQQLAGYPLTGAPSAVQFIEMLYNALVRAVRKLNSVTKNVTMTKKRTPIPNEMAFFFHGGGDGSRTAIKSVFLVHIVHIVQIIQQIFIENRYILSILPI